MCAYVLATTVVLLCFLRFGSDSMVIGAALLSCGGYRAIQSSVGTVSNGVVGLCNGLG